MSGKHYSRKLLQLSAVFTVALISVLALISARSATAAAPTVNGLFYGDGDNNIYTLIATSYFSSELYAYYDPPTKMLYVALVVDRSINDNVFGASDGGYSGNYMASAGWGAGGGQQRGANVLTDSEFAGFRFACEPSSAKDWEWHQGYACETGGVWVSDSTCSTSSGETSGYPPSWQSASSFAWNINTYEAQSPGPYPWDMYVFGTGIASWKSPFSSSDPNTVPGLDGYPVATDSGDLSLGPPITHSVTYDWEWPMVYEWSINLGPSGTDCGSNGLYLVTGLSHHSPLKEGTGSAADKYGTTQMEDWCGEENDCFPDEGEPDPFADWGDLPDSYSTIGASSGPSHTLTVAGPYLGQDVQFESDGQPTTDATGDGSEEDGVLRDMSDLWQPDATVNLTATVSGATGRLAGWFDWDNDGTFDESAEMVDFGALVTGTHSLTVSISSSYVAGTTIHARFRLFDPSAIPGGSVDLSDYQGPATGGEVEDYRWEFTTNAVKSYDVAADLGRDLRQILMTSLLAAILLGLAALLLKQARKQQA